MSDPDNGIYTAMREHSKQNRANNLAYNTGLIERSGLVFSSHNGGVHLKLCVPDSPIIVDYWPSTGRWIFKIPYMARKDGRGTRELIRLLGGEVVEA